VPVKIVVRFLLISYKQFPEPIVMPGIDTFHYNPSSLPPFVVSYLLLTFVTYV
jgi:hypothetical protein